MGEEDTSLENAFLENSSVSGEEGEHVPRICS